MLIHAFMSKLSQTWEVNSHLLNPYSVWCTTEEELKAENYGTCDLLTEFSLGSTFGQERRTQKKKEGHCKSLAWDGNAL